MWIGSIRDWEMIEGKWINHKLNLKTLSRIFKRGEGDGKCQKIVGYRNVISCFNLHLIRVPGEKNIENGI